MRPSLLSSCFPRVCSGPSATSLLFGRSMWRNPLPLVVVLLSLLLFSRSCTNVFQDSSSFSLFLPVSALPLRDPVFPETVQLGIACDVCSYMIINLVLQIARALKIQGEVVPTSEDTEEFLEHLCEPDNVGGAWIRRLGFFVTPSNEDDPDSPVHFELRTLKNYTKCKRGCVTARDACQDVSETPFFEELMKRIPLFFKEEGGPDVSEEGVRKLRYNICQRFEVCQRQMWFREDLDRILNFPGNRIRKQIEEDRIEWMTPDELDTEITMYESQRRFNAESFTRVEMIKLRDAIARGDRKAAAAIDRKIFTLSKEEFEELRKTVLEQFDEDF